ncbi:porin [Methylobacterium sp. C25]|uniref:porin n=1 Tax=Methylobacterium sp. C25 TaxID=2721622 RepID=UPI001F411839|nr:porin [Methylobacterium sp. C25]MCE4222158.1 porin [Methylobacterium sp. C25]
MYGIRSALLCGTAAVTALGAAHAADLPVKKAAPIEYVRVCGAYGAGFFYIPGTDTCIRVSGRARFEAGTIPNPDRSRGSGDESQFRGLLRIAVDARTQTDYGTLRAFVREEIASRSGTLLSSATQLRIANAFFATGQDSYSRVQNFAVTEKAFIQFAGLTAGRASSFFDFYAHDYELIGTTGGSDIASTNLLAYTKTFDGGFSATISMEDPAFRRQPVYSPNFTTTLPVAGTSTFLGLGTNAPAPIILTTNGAFDATSVAYLDAVQRSRLPDFVGVLRYDAPWGSAQLSGALHETNVGGFLSTAGSGAIAAPSAAAAQALLAARGVTSGAQTADGWAVQGGLKVNLPMIAPGDGFYLQGAYAEGAMSYTGYTYLTGSYSTNLTPVQGASFNQYVPDAVVNPITGKLDLTKAFTVSAAYLHYWTPQWRSAFFGSYGQVNFNRGTRQAYSLLGTNFATGAPPSAFTNPAAFAVSPVLRDNAQVTAGASIIWSPVKDLDIGVEGTYIGTSVLEGRVADATRPGNDVNGVPIHTVKRYDATQIRMRVQRDF